MKGTKTPTALVVGSGIGGMTAALELQRGGFRVIIVEKNTSVGGKMSRVNFAGCMFDTGPSLVTMPFVFEEFFHRHNADFHSQVLLNEIEPGCRYFWRDGTKFDAYTNPAMRGREVKRVFENDIESVEKYFLHAKKVYDATKDIFLFREFDGFIELLKPKNLPLLRYLPTLQSHKSLHNFNRSFFSDGKLTQLFNRFATYNGSSPYLAPATLAVIAHVEFGFGAWYPIGGVYEIALAFQRLCNQNNIEVRLQTEVAKILHTNNKVYGAELSNGERIECDVVVSNTDVYLTYEKLMGLTLKKKNQLSCSGFSALLAVSKKERDLIHHNILFSDNYKKEFHQIFNEEVPPDAPTIYISRSSHTDNSQAEPDRENWFLLVNAPSTANTGYWLNNRERYAELCINQMKHYGLDIKDDILDMKLRTPDEFESDHTAYKGSLYGSSSNSMFSAFLRPRNRSKLFKNLYFTGGTTHPGGGVPLVCLSGQISARCILRDFSMLSAHE